MCVAPLTIQIGHTECQTQCDQLTHNQRADDGRVTDASKQRQQRKPEHSKEENCKWRYQAQAEYIPTPKVPTGFLRRDVAARDFCMTEVNRIDVVVQS